MYYVDMDVQTAVNIILIQYASILQDIDENQCREVRVRSLLLSSLSFAELRVSKMNIKGGLKKQKRF